MPRYLPTYTSTAMYVVSPTVDRFPATNGSGWNQSRGPLPLSLSLSSGLSTPLHSLNRSWPALPWLQLAGAATILACFYTHLASSFLPFHLVLCLLFSSTTMPRHQVAMACQACRQKRVKVRQHDMTCHTDITCFYTLVWIMAQPFPFFSLLLVSLIFLLSLSFLIFFPCRPCTDGSI